MRKVLLVLGILLIAACSEKGPEAIEAEISEKKKELNALNKEITELEKLLAEMDTTENIYRTVVRVKDMEPVEFKHFISVNGVIEAVSEAWISPEINGQINEIPVERGQKVSQGQLLIRLSTDVTQRNIEEVKTNLELASNIFEKQERLWNQGIGTEVQYLESKNNVQSLEARLATLEEQRGMAVIRAPFSGIVEEISVKSGELAMPGSRLLHLVNPERLRLNADISENYLTSIKEGEMVDVIFPLYNDLEMELPISRVGSVIDNEARTFEVELELRNPGGKIKPNQIAIMKINDFQSDSAFVVPSIIIKNDGTGYYLYRTTEDSEGNLKATKLYITPGRSYEDQTMVVEGLESGMQVIIEGYNLVKDGSLIKIKE
jgi:RND family efflux transporter MFP subunit